MEELVLWAVVALDHAKPGEYRRDTEHNWRCGHDQMGLPLTEEWQLYAEYQQRALECTEAFC
jgi:hypothetical protein